MLVCKSLLVLICILIAVFWNSKETTRKNPQKNLQNNRKKRMKKWKKGKKEKAWQKKSRKTNELRANMNNIV